MVLQEYDQETKDYEVERHAVFWSDEGCKSLYKNHLKCVWLVAPSSAASLDSFAEVLSLLKLLLWLSRHQMLNSSILPTPERW